MGTWATDFFRMSLQGTAFGDLQWMQWWTYFMMAWWVSWGAFVGVFLARISRGRTIRGFIVGVLAVPTVVFFTWFTVFGGTAIHVDMFEGGTIAEQTATDINSAFFATLDTLPLATITSVIAIILVVMFFVSGADANTYVLSMMTSNGSLQPRRSVLVLWGVLTGVTAVVLMLAGGLNALQNTVIVTSAPFLVIIAGLTVAFWKELLADRRAAQQALAERARAVEAAALRTTPLAPASHRTRSHVHRCMTNSPQEPRPPQTRRKRHAERLPQGTCHEDLGGSLGPGRGRRLRHPAQPRVPASQQLDRRGTLARRVQGVDRGHPLRVPRPGDHDRRCRRGRGSTGDPLAQRWSTRTILPRRTGNRPDACR